MFARHAVQPNGFIYARWNQFEYVNMTIHDQMPHFILAYYRQVVNTGDADFLASALPGEVSGFECLNCVYSAVMAIGKLVNSVSVCVRFGERQWQSPKKHSKTPWRPGASLG